MRASRSTLASTEAAATTAQRASGSDLSFALCFCIGSHVLKALLKQGGHEITVVDNLCKGTTKALDALEKIGKFKFVKANLEDDLSGIFAEGKFDAIIHFAAFIEVFESTQEPLKYYLNNTANVAKILTLFLKTKFTTKKTLSLLSLKR